MKKQSTLMQLILCALPVIAAAVPSSLLTDTGSLWYAQLQKPAFNPPEWAFPAAWSVVYLCDILALFSARRQGVIFRGTLPGALVLCGLMNILWALVFFRLHLPVTGAVVLFILLLALLISYVLLRRQAKKPALWLLPNLIWGVFALALNIAFALLNT